MKFINIDFPLSRDEVLCLLRDNERVNRNVRFDESRGRPLMKIREKGNSVKITCEMIGGPTKDNGFFIGTYFRGKLIERDGITKLCGVVTTAPIYHLALLALIAVFIVQCFKLSGFSVVPPILVVFDLFMFKNEFKKQGYIKRYLHRALRRVSEE